MKEFEFVIRDPLGLHARPAGILSRTASDFTSKITLNYGTQSVQLRRLIAVIALQAKQGERVRIQAEGEDEESAITQLHAVCQQSL